MAVMVGFPRVGWVRAPEEAERSDRLSGDPLGLRVFVPHLGGRISPGLGRGQSNAWGLGLLCAGVELAGSGLRCEQWFVRWQRLALFASLDTAARLRGVDEQGKVQPVWRVGGIEKARRLVRTTSGSVALDEQLRANELGGGLWGGHARAGRLYGLVATQGTTRLADHRATEQGRRLAAATLAAIGADRDELERAVCRRGPVSLSDLRLQLDRPPAGYLDVLAEVLRDGDARWGGRLAWLWPYLDGLADDDPNELPEDAEPIDASQAGALQAARPVAELLRLVEGAFRADAADGLTPELAEHEAFAAADREGYSPEYEPIRAALAPGGQQALEQLWALHRRRHAHTGAWDRGEQHTPYEAARPDFGLRAPLHLHDQGVRL